MASGGVFMGMIIKAESGKREAGAGNIGSILSTSRSPAFRPTAYRLPAYRLPATAFPTPRTACGG